jgi:hypothetical protein
MNTVGIFAGRGDVILAMGLSFGIGLYAGWQSRKLVEWIRKKVKRDHTV